MHRAGAACTRSTRGCGAQSEFSGFRERHGQGRGDTQRRETDAGAEIQPVFGSESGVFVGVCVMDSRGRVYAAGGSDAKVVRFDDPAKPTTVFESPELAAQAIAFDAQDNLYVGTSPDGKVYKVTPDGQKSVFFEPKTKYIWALAMDAQGTLFVATGDTGRFLRSRRMARAAFLSKRRAARAVAGVRRQREILLVGHGSGWFDFAY